MAGGHGEVESSLTADAETTSRLTGNRVGLGAGHSPLSPSSVLLKTYQSNAVLCLFSGREEHLTPENAGALLAAERNCAGEDPRRKHHVIRLTGSLQSSDSDSDSDTIAADEGM